MNYDYIKVAATIGLEICSWFTTVFGWIQDNEMMFEDENKCYFVSFFKWRPHLNQKYNVQSYTVFF